MSPSWQHGSQRKQVEFREWVVGEGFYTEEIPSGTFADTEIRTVLLVLTKAQAAEGRQPISDSERVIADVCNGRTIWNSDGTDGDCLICPPPAAAPAAPGLVLAQPKPALQRSRRRYDLISQL